MKSIVITSFGGAPACIPLALLQKWCIVQAYYSILTENVEYYEGVAIRCGDQIKVRRSWVHHHHGIYMGGGMVVDFYGEDKQSAIVRITTIAVFAGRRKIKVVPRCEARCLSRYETAVRAACSVGDNLDGYHLRQTNCEHFANWCKTGKWKSGQVDNVTVAIGGAVGAFTGFGARHVAIRTLGIPFGLWGAVAITVAVPVATYIYRQYTQH